MSKILLEASPFSLDLRTLANQQQSESANEAEDAGAAQATSNSTLPAKGDWGAWGNLYKERLQSNKSLSPDARYTDHEIETKFFEEFFTVNWGEAVAAKLSLLGDPLRKTFKVLGFNPSKERGGNPILGFIVQAFTKKLLIDGLLNASTFKAIYNAVAKKLVADSEFFKENNYNILYCTNLYTKSASEIEKYLTLQSKILRVNLTEYDTNIQTKNKKVFLHTDAIQELDPVKRALEINKEETPTVDSVSNATLNSLDLAEVINGNTRAPTVKLDDVAQGELINQLDSPAKIFAALMSLSLSTNSKEAVEALNNAVFNSLTAQQVAEATTWLATNKVMVKGQLQDSVAKALVSKIVAKLATAQK